MDKQVPISMWISPFQILDSRYKENMVKGFKKKKQ